MIMTSKYRIIDIAIYIINKSIDDEKDLDYVKLTEILYMTNKIYYRRHNMFLYDNSLIKQINGYISIPDLYYELRQTYIGNDMVFQFSFDNKIKTYKEYWATTMNENNKLITEEIVYDVEKDIVNKIDSKDKLFIDMIYNKYIDENNKYVFKNYTKI